MNSIHAASLITVSSRTTLLCSGSPSRLTQPSRTQRCATKHSALQKVYDSTSRRPPAGAVLPTRHGFTASHAASCSKLLPLSRSQPSLETHSAKPSLLQAPSPTDTTPCLLATRANHAPEREPEPEPEQLVRVWGSIASGSRARGWARS
jgi:hypothetical protein